MPAQVPAVVTLDVREGERVAVPPVTPDHECTPARAAAAAAQLRSRRGDCPTSASATPGDRVADAAAPASAAVPSRSDWTADR